MNTPAVSIILPTYNRAKFLPEAIGAIRGQQFTDWELIVVDDGSTDETAELLPRLVEGMSQPYRYIRQENRGSVCRAKYRTGPCPGAVRGIL